MMGGNREYPNRNSEVECVRLLLALSVVLCHTGYFVGWESVDNPMSQGYLAVEVFYLISGYFLCQSLDKVGANGDLLSFLMKRAKSFYPELVVSIFFALFYKLLIAVPDNGRLSLVSHTLVEDVLLLKMTGIIHIIRGGSANGVVWYLSSMLLVSAFMYLFYKRQKVDVILFLLTLFSFCYLLFVFRKGIGDPLLMKGGIYCGNVRAFSEMGLGMCAYAAANKLKGLNISTGMQTFSFVVKYVVLLIWFGYMLTPRSYMPNSLLPFSLLMISWVSCVWLWLVLTMGIKKCTNDKHPAYFAIPQLMGKVSLPLYLSHNFYASSWNAVMPATMSVQQKVLCYLLISIATAVLVMCGARLVRRYVPLFGTKKGV